MRTSGTRPGTFPTGLRRGALSLLCCSVVLLLTQYAAAQQTILSPNRSIDWSSVGIAGGIPVRTTTCATLNPGATAAQISSALSSCPSGQVVKLNPGTYNVGGIDFGGGKANVTLRGAGADQTFLVFSSSTSCNGLGADVCLQGADNNWRGGPSNTANWTAGYARGTTVITLDSTANLSVGETIILDQEDDLSDNGIIYICEQSASISPNQNPPCNDDAGGTGGDSGGQRGSGTPQVRGQQQIVTVTAINGSQVSISPALYMPNWRASQRPGAWWGTTQASMIGIENMSLDHSSSNDTYGIALKNCNNCWVSGVRSVVSNRAHVKIQTSPRAVVRDSYFYGTLNAATTSYGIEAFASSDTLVENNIFQRVEGPLKINADCAGCVLGYNFSINDDYSPSRSWLQQSTGLHSLNDNLLMEGNVGSGLYMDAFHGTHNFNTAFRNRWNGYEPNNGTPTTGHSNPVIIFPYSRYNNLIGNVLGSTARHTIYTFLPGSSGNGDQAIYVLGTGTVNCCLSGDLKVSSTLYRWGNYDTVTGAAQWNASEVPSGLSQFANLLPTTQLLPATLYLSGRPGWFGTVPWPPIGPDVTGGNIANVGGHAYKIPAQVCYSTVMGGPADGVGSVLTFDAATCYGAVSSPPRPPTNLRIIPALTTLLFDPAWFASPSALLR
jgi:hypothetical protein